MKRMIQSVLFALALAAVCSLLATGDRTAFSQASVALSQATTASEWNTVAGNLERTSRVSEQVDAQNLNLEWYRPIEAYMPQDVQIIAANGLLYISTSRGLYTLYATDPDGDGPLGAGDEKWRFDTELPLGNSPTVVDGVAYVGGFDRKLHALDALTGAHLWAFDGAQAGYSANPLVADGRVLLGNRDGYFYALGAQGTPQQGQLLWKFKTEGPIVISAAYKDGIVYFASNDNYAYALRADTGTLFWKSAKLPGDGFNSYWPVVYQDKVIFSGASGYRANLDPGTSSVKTPEGNPEVSYSMMQKDDLFFDKSDYGPIGPPVSTTDPWAAGKQVIDGSRLSQYLEDNPDGDAHLHKPWRRVSIVLNRGDGSEFTYDSDGDGHPEYAPIALWGTSSGNIYPPVVGSDGVLYQNNIYLADSGTWTIPQGQVMGWEVGTPYLSLAGAQGAVDEPQAISVGGGTLYRSICCDRVGSWTDLANPNSAGTLWGYNLSSQAPGYDEMWWGIDPNGLPGLTGNYGTNNGIYHSHGVQNPLVPYQGRLFVHRSNAIIAYGSGTVRGKLPRLPVQAVKDSVSTPSTAELTARLESQVQAMVSAGNLRPGYYNTGQSVEPERSWMSSYFENPGDTLYTLAIAYPYLSAVLQQQVKAYLSTEFQTYFDPTMYARRGWSEGVARESMSIPPEVQASMARGNKSSWAGDANDLNLPWYYPQHNLYAMWKYAQLLGSDPYVQRIYELAKSELEVPVASFATADYFKKWPWYLNGFIDGYTGFLRLQELAGMTGTDAGLRSQVQAELTRLLDMRVDIFTKDSYWVDPNNPNLPVEGGDYHQRAYNVSRNFIWLTPELGDQLRQRILPKVQEALREYHWVAPYWFVSRYDATVNEGVMQNLYDSPALLQAEAYILEDPYQELVKYLDVPGFQRGDLFYIQNLVAVLESASAPQTPTPTPGGPTATALPTTELPTPTPVSSPTQTMGTTMVDPADVGSLPAGANVLLDFDNFPNPVNNQPVPAGYAGLTWSNIVEGGPWAGNNTWNVFILNDGPQGTISFPEPVIVNSMLVSSDATNTFTLSSPGNPSVSVTTSGSSPKTLATGWAVPVTSLMLQAGPDQTFDDLLVTVADGGVPATAVTATPTLLPPTATPTANFPVPLAPKGITANAVSVPTYDRCELTFNITGSVATEPQIPFDPSPPPGLAGGNGISVEGVFLPPGQTDWGQALIQPGFLYQDYQRQQVDGKEWLYPQGEPTWKVRFAPKIQGTWQYRVRAQDASNYPNWSQSTIYSFTATTPQSHGFVETSKSDSRYFAFSDGSRFTGLGTNTAFADLRSTYDADAKLPTYASNGVDFLRTWMSSTEMAGSAWNPWTVFPGSDYYGYIPEPGLQNAPNGSGHDFTFKLGQSQPCLFNGLVQGGIAVKPATSYRLAVTAQIAGVTGPRNAANPYGLTIKTGSWPASCPDGTSGYQVLLPHVGNSDWSTFQATFSTNASQYFLEYLFLTLDNVTAGDANVSDVSLREVMADGSLGPELLPKSESDMEEGVSPQSSWVWDYVLDQAAHQGVYIKPVTLEKNDRVWNRIKADGTVTSVEDNENFY